MVFTNTHSAFVDHSDRSCMLGEYTVVLFTSWYFSFDLSNFRFLLIYIFSNQIFIKIVIDIL